MQKSIFEIKRIAPPLTFPEGWRSTGRRGGDGITLSSSAAPGRRRLSWKKSWWLSTGRC